MIKCKTIGSRPDQTVCLLFEKTKAFTNEMICATLVFIANSSMAL
jgi:hypothetical protein